MLQSQDRLAELELTLTSEEQAVLAEADRVLVEGEKAGLQGVCSLLSVAYVKKIFKPSFFSPLSDHDDLGH
jgi:hypothetical protein